VSAPGRTARRRRRTKAEIGLIKGALYDVLYEDHPQTVRQVFYRLTTQGVVAKTEAEYKGTVCRLLAEMRRGREIPYTWLADATRWQRAPQTFSSVEDALQRTASAYRRALWDGRPERVEIWLEKEALAGVVVNITHEWDVPLMVTRGYPSMSYLHSAAEQIVECAEHGQRTYIYYFGDRDPSGVDIDRAIQEGICESIAALIGLPQQDQLRRFGWFEFERVGVTEEQIIDLQLPSRPTKKTDTRSKTFTGDSVELDAIPAQRLKTIVADAIEVHVDHEQLAVLRKVEAEEREGLEHLAGMTS
jgi:hypothetical protein